MKTEIIKVQTPLFTNDPKMINSALVYNQDRSYYEFIELSLVKGRMKDSVKKFFEAEFDLAGNLFSLLDEVKDPGW